MIYTLNRKSLVINSTLLQYYDADQPAETTLLFLHGWRSESKVWQSVIQRLNGKYRIYCVDLPGFGGSELPRYAYSLDDYAETVEAFLDRLKISKVALIGHSFGGAVGIKTALKYPQRVRSLILVDSSGIRKKKIVKSLSTVAAKLLKPVFTLPFMQRVRKKIYESMGAEDYVTRSELKDIYLKVIQEDLSPLLKTITVPTTLIWGRNDTETPLEHAKLMKSEIPHAQLFVIPRAGHYSFLDDTNEFVKILENNL